MSLTELLDFCHEKLLDGPTHDCMEELVTTLFQLRSSSPPAAWRELISVCRQHPICSALHQDPLTNRSFHKPRGYPGDAMMLDMMYDFNAFDRPIGADLGRNVFRYTAGSGRSPQAVRYRRSLIAQMVDDICDGSSAKRVLSIAAGHLREAEISDALKSNRIAEWVAIDQDEQSVAEMERHYCGSAVRSLKASVRQVLSGKSALGHFDFVYAAGLFDYLSFPVAQALLSRMVEMLKPEGTVLIANFAPDLVDAGYMETFMDWSLTYRSERDMNSLLSTLGDGATHNRRLFSDDWGAIVYASVERSL